MPGEPGEVAIVRCGTSAGPFVMHFHRDWSPHGYDRAVTLFEKGYYDDSHFFRVVPGFLVQFGITYSPSEELKKAALSPIPDDLQLDPPITFEPGTISYAGSGPNSRTSQLFIAHSKSAAFGTQPWETPVGRVVEGFEETVKKFYSYGDMPPWGKGPVQGKIYSGRNYIEQNFPLTDKFLTCHVERGTGKPQRGGMEERELMMQDTLDEWAVKAKDKAHVIADKAHDMAGKATTMLRKSQVSIGGTDKLGALVIICVASMVVLVLLVGVRTRQKASKAS